MSLSVHSADSGVSCDRNECEQKYYWDQSLYRHSVSHAMTEAVRLNPTVLNALYKLVQATILSVSSPPWTVKDNHSLFRIQS